MLGGLVELEVEEGGDGLFGVGVGGCGWIGGG